MTWNNFIGTELPNGWKVASWLAPQPGDTGGNFGTCFIVERNGVQAFLKAFDIERIFQRTAGDLNAMQRELESINFEIRLLDICGAANTKHVVVALEKGEIVISGVNLNAPIKYLIFQLAKQDIRRFNTYRNDVDYVINLEILKCVSRGLGELHRLEIAHQDLKPSNVLMYDDYTSRIADLGRSSKFGEGVWHDNLTFAGDPGYAPPEVSYRALAADWHTRRWAQDLYMLGSLAIFLYTSVNLTAQVFSNLHDDFHPRNWKDSYKQVLPYLRKAFIDAISQNEYFNTKIGSELRSTICELCDPDPLKRGSPRIESIPGKYSLQRYSSIFERLSAEVRLRGKSA